MLLPVGHERIAYRTACHLASEVPAHAVTHDKQSPVIAHLNDAATVLVVLSWTFL